MSLSGCQINLVDVNFHLQKRLETFDKKSADKVKSEKDKGIKVPSLMPIRVNTEMPCVVMELEFPQPKLSSGYPGRGALT